MITVDNMSKSKLSDVRITKSEEGTGYIISVEDEYTNNYLAVTREELVQILMRAEEILRKK